MMRVRVGQDESAAVETVRVCVEQIYPALVRALAASGVEVRHLHRHARAVLFNELVGRLASARGLSSVAFRPPVPISHLQLDASAHERSFESLSAVDLSCVPVRVLGAVYERLLGLACHGREPWVSVDPSPRRSSGSYYTPDSIVSYIVESTIGPILDRRIADTDPCDAGLVDRLLDFRVLDPAMGTGHFLVGALDYISDRVQTCLDQRASSSPGLLERSMQASRIRSLVLGRCIQGVERDPFAAAVARAALCIHVGKADPVGAALEVSLRAADALRTLGIDESQWGMYDAVIGNPPFVDSETMTRRDAGFRHFARRHFISARGNWDLYVLFVELAMRLVRPGGLCAMVTPTRLLASDYARSIQSMMLERTLVSCRDYAHVRVFDDAQVPVVVPVIENTPPTDAHKVGFSVMGANMREHRVRHFRQSDLRKLPGGYIALPLRAEDDDVLAAAAAPATRLEDVAACSDGATTSEAYALREVLTESPVADPAEAGWIRLVNSGLVDPFLILWGRKPCRYLGRSLRRPVVEREHLARLAPRRLKQAQMHKVIVAGLSARLEAAVAPPGILCGKSAVLVVPHEGVCPHALAAVLNSSFISAVYRGLFGLRALSHASMSIGPRQLAKLPIPGVALLRPAAQRDVDWSAIERLDADELLTQARACSLLSSIGRARAADDAVQLGQTADRIVRTAMLDQ